MLTGLRNELPRSLERAEVVRLVLLGLGIKYLRESPNSSEDTGQEAQAGASEPAGAFFDLAHKKTDAMATAREIDGEWAP